MVITRFARQVGRLAHGAIAAPRAAVGLDPADDEVIESRRRICAECDQATARKNLTHLGLHALSPVSRCRMCRCQLHLKTRLASERCPRGLW